MKIRFQKNRLASHKCRRHRRSGFSLLEMLFVVAILTVVMGVVFRQIGEMQKRSRTEDMKLDLTQESREYMDEIVRDMHSIGYPTKTMYAAGTITVTPAWNDQRVAAGLVKVAYDELWFEGDVDGNGTVAVIDYKLQPGTGGNCPCKISRMQMPKVDGVAPMSQTFVSYSMELTDVINSGMGGTGGTTGAPKYTITGSEMGSTGTANDTTFSAYKSANVFTYFDINGKEVTPTDISTTAGQNSIATIRSIRVNINVLGHQADLQTGMRPVMSYSAAVRLPNQ